MKEICTFIFVHDQKIVEDYINHDKFNQLSNVKYVFVGNNDSSRIESYSNVIICNKLPINIENYPKLTSFTGWYALWKNKLYNPDAHINLFEYDVNISPYLEKNINENSHYDIIGYIPLNIHDGRFIKVKEWSDVLLWSIQKKYNINSEDFIDALPSDKKCSITSNHTMTGETFEKYMNWVEPMLNYIKYSELSGHQIERSIPLFYLLNQLNYKVIENLLDHFQFDTHGEAKDELLKDQYHYLFQNFMFDKIKLITFAKGNFIESQNKLKAHLDSIGIPNQQHFTDNDLPIEFLKDYSEILSFKKGYGYCIWKSFIILQELNKIKEDEILLYIDSTDLPERSFFEEVVRNFNHKDYLLLNRGYNHGQWTKRDTFVLMNCDEPQYYDHVQLEAGVIGLKSTKFNKELVKKWFEYSTNKNILTELPNICGLPNVNDFIEHRYDQSILTNLAIKNNLVSYNFTEEKIKYNYFQPQVYYMEKIFETRDQMLNSFDKNLIIAELGVFEGEFSKRIKEICQPSKLYLIDLFDGHFGSGDKDGQNYHFVQLDDEMHKIIDHFKDCEEVYVIKNSTINFLNTLEDNYLDMVYIDADHSYNSVLEDLRLSYKKVKNGGLICGHDYVEHTEAKAAVDQFCQETNLEIKYLTKDGCPSFCIEK
jgi:hypothetical protein